MNPRSMNEKEQSRVMWDLDGTELQRYRWYKRHMTQHLTFGASAVSSMSYLRHPLANRVWTNNVKYYSQARVLIQSNPSVHKLKRNWDTVTMKMINYTLLSNNFLSSMSLTWASSKTKSHSHTLKIWRKRTHLNWPIIRPMTSYH